MREKKRNGLSRALRIFYGVGDCGYTLTTNVESYFFSFFLTNMAQYSMATISVITTVTSVVCAILVGVAGGIINSSKPMRWGRYRSWLVVIPWLIPLIYPFQFVKIGDGVVSGLIIMAAAIISHTLWQFPYVASISMISVAGKTQEERAQLSSTRAMWNSFSKVIFSLVGVPLAGVFASILGTKNQYAGVAFCLGLAMVIGYYIHFRMFEGYEEKEDTLQNQKAPAKEKTSLKDLADPVYAGQVAVTDIQSSSTAWLLIQALVDAYGDDGAQEVLSGIYDNCGAHIETSGSGPLKLCRAGEVAIGFGLRHQAVADKADGLPIDYVDPAEGNFSLTESVAVLDKGEDTNPLAMEMAQCIIENGREELLQTYPNPLYEGETADPANQSANPSVFDEPLTFELFQAHQQLSEAAKG